MGWREMLQEHLNSEARSNQSALSRLFARACQDLETRCEDIEQPLRNERADHAALQKRYDQLQEIYAEQEAQMMDRKLHYDTLEAEKDQCVYDLDTAREEADRWLGKADELEQALRVSNSEARGRLAELQAVKDVTDLQHATAIAKIAEELEDLQESSAKMKELMNTKVEELAKAEVELDGIRVAKGSLQADGQRLSRELHDKVAEIDGLQNTVDQNAAQLKDMNSEIDLLRESLAKERQAHEQNLQQVKEHHWQNVEAANASHNELMDRLAAQHGEEVANLEQQLTLLQEGSEKTAEQHTNELQKWEEDLGDAQQQVCVTLPRSRGLSELTWCRLIVCSGNASRRDQQITEANSMRSNLMAAMGLGPSAGLATQASLPHRTRTSSARTQQYHQSQLDPSPPTPLSGHSVDGPLGDGWASFGSNASSGHSRSGPTPKRAKPRKLFKAPSPAKPRLSISARVGRGTSDRTATKRQPLQNMSANRSPRRSAPKTPSKAAWNDAADGFDDSTLDENELFAHTPGVTKTLDLGGMLE